MRKIILLLLCFFLFLLLLLLPISHTPYPSPAFAQNCSSSYSSRVQGGLISTRRIELLSKIGDTSGACVIDEKAAFAPYKVPGYNDLKSLYFDQYKGPATDKVTLTGDKGEGGLLTEINTNNKKLIYITGNLGINGNDLLGINKTAVVFVDGYLRFYSALPQFIYGDGNSGIVFVVKQNVYIDTAVTRVDAVIISEGIICTAYDGTSCTNAVVPAPQLVINGSLISLNESAPIKFKRSLANNNTPAEIINHQVKYLVILRNLMSDTYQKWSEIQ